MEDVQSIQDKLQEAAGEGVKVTVVEVPFDFGKVFSDMVEKARRNSDEGLEGVPFDALVKHGYELFRHEVDDLRDHIKTGHHGDEEAAFNCFMQGKALAMPRTAGIMLYAAIREGTRRL